MSRKHWIFVFAGILVLHGLIFFLIKDGPVLPPQWLMDQSTSEPTFKYDEAKYLDPNTGEKMIVQEFTVKTIQAPNGAATPFPAP